MKKILISAILLALAAASANAAVTSAQLYAKLQAAYANLSGFQASVKQSNYYLQLKKTIDYDGMLYFTPGRMLMSFTKPSVQRLLIQNGKVELYDAQSNTLFKASVMAQFGRMNPLEILQLYWNKSSVTILGEEKGLVKVKLVPAKDDLVTSLSASINPSTGIVSVLGYADKTGNTVTYAFSGIKANAAIPASVWSYNYPKNVQIVEQ
jgi:outer membrane lipoprotein-sorting protein